MKKILLVMLLLVVSVHFSFSDTNLNVNAMVGHIVYDIGILKDKNTQMVNQSVTKLKIVDNYPITPYFQFDGDMQFDLYKIGISYGKVSTGSRLHSQDYSGEHKIDNLVRYQQYGIYVKIFIKPLSLEDFCVYTEGYIGFGKIKVDFESKEFIRVFEESQSQSSSISDDKVYIEPGIIASLKYMNFNLSGKLCLNFITDEYQIGDWDGIRIGLMFGYNLNL